MRFFLRSPQNPAQMTGSHAEEIAAICLSRQIEHLALSKHMRADIGLDCGCSELPFRKAYLT